MTSLLLVSPRVFHRQDEKTAHCWEPLGLGRIATYLTHKFPELEIEILSGDFDDDSKIISHGQAADITAFSCISNQMAHANKLAKEIKHNQNFIVYGGYHPSALPLETQGLSFVDCVVVGEGENGMEQIINGKRDPFIYSKKMERLGELPYLDREMYHLEKYIRNGFIRAGARFASQESSRGCPANCTFCASKLMWSRRVRFFPAEFVVHEIKEAVREYNIDTVTFTDDTFTANPGRAMDIADALIADPPGCDFTCNARVNTVGEKLLGKLKGANFTQIAYGVESGDERILANYDKGINLKQVRKAFELTKSFGIDSRGYFLIGAPEDNLQTIANTERFIDGMMPWIDKVGITILVPYPGTAYYKPEYSRYNWSQVSFYSPRESGYKGICDNLTIEELVAEQQRLLEKYGDLAVDVAARAGAEVAA